MSLFRSASRGIRVREGVLLAVLWGFGIWGLPVVVDLLKGGN